MMICPELPRFTYGYHVIKTGATRLKTREALALLAAKMGDTLYKTAPI